MKLLLDELMEGMDEGTLKADGFDLAVIGIASRC